MQRRTHRTAAALAALAFALALPACGQLAGTGATGSAEAETQAVVSDRAASGTGTGEAAEATWTFVNCTGREVSSIEIKPSEQVEYDEDGLFDGLALADGGTAEIAYGLSADADATYDLRITLSDGSVMIVYLVRPAAQSSFELTAEGEDAHVAYADSETGETVSSSGKVVPSDEADEITYDLVTQTD